MSISKAVSQCIEKIKCLGLSGENHKTSDLAEIDKSEFLQEDTTATKACPTVSQSSPGLEYSITPRQLERITPPPNLKDLNDSQDQGEKRQAIRTKITLHELLSISNTEQEPLKPRPRPRYHDCYRMSLPGVEDEDISTISQYDDEDSDAFVNISDEDLDDASGNAGNSFNRLGSCGSNGGHSNQGEEHQRNAKPRPDRFESSTQAHDIAANLTTKSHALGPEPRPSDEVIAKMTIDQRRQVCYIRSRNVLKRQSDSLIVIGMENSYA